MLAIAPQAIAKVADVKINNDLTPIPIDHNVYASAGIDYWGINAHLTISPKLLRDSPRVLQ